MQWPVNSPSRVTLSFHEPLKGVYAPGEHNGTDIDSDDKKVLSVHDGTVTFAGWLNDRSGNMVAVDDGNPRITYSHLKKGGIRVKVGQKVKAGDYLADMGDTGNASGVHVHVVVNSGKDDLEKLVPQGGSMARAIINKDLIYLMRVMNSEVKGWPHDVAHNSKTDKKELKAWEGKPVADFSQQAWDEGANYRKQKAEWKAAFEREPGHKVQIKTLEAQLKSAHARIKELEKSSGATKRQLAIEKAVDALEEARNL